MDFVNGISMAGGDGAQSYTNNSLYQRAVMDAGMLLVQKSIADHIQPTSLETFSIADLGCSVGPNTFIAMDNILESVKLKYQNANNKIPEFQVYFNDHALNDFNTLFKSLPPNRDYHASGVPGSFYTRLFPRASLRIAYSSYSLQWLSQVPTEIMDPTSPAYNKGRISCMGDNQEVINAYSRQHFKDFSDFLHARAQEIVPGGLLMLILPARSNGVHHSRDPFSIMNDRLGACLMDLAKKGVIDEAKVDAYNLPQYIASPHEFEEIIKKNGHFDIERMEGLPEAKASYRPSSPEEVTRGIRAVMEELVKEHFGHEILDDVFDIFQEKLAEAPDPGPELNLFILLKLKEDNVIKN
ncbi:probable S-adenosylmethionine-dependent methyltransferase at5g37990 [Phtheirospermum japonicum]|uniref:Probable S-adenosylmethionine-dependent methyltransferase at5g37990 n=1 Tax=Phtheirospermum japonicum TaxID=374723 RepID=A0A830BLA9_9LAMI|nr:probable S-adenosylmethionine-dependent methyltransferase at5g37990 [Phtheirospermum japonicum]